MKKNATYDVVIVGAGITGGIVANQLAEQGFRVLILEAGEAKDFSFSTYREYVHYFYNNPIKVPNSPFPQNPNAPQPYVTDVGNIEDGIQQFNEDAYFRQMGPAPFQSSYTRSKGGTTLHWLGTCLRMLPSDFKEKDLFNKGKNWPIGYYDLQSYYQQAEREIGVSAEVEEQRFHGVEFEDGYVYPMHKIPQSYLDQKLTEWTAGATFTDSDGQSYPYQVVSTPQGRNSHPNAAYDGGKGFVPVGAVGNPDVGQRCEGNSACVPICPVQAKYNALKTLHKAVEKGVVIQSQSVATEILIDSSTGAVTGIKYKHYDNVEKLRNGQTPKYEEKTITAKRYVLAAHAVENAKLMLASGFKNKNIGQNLMDHPVVLTWGLTPENENIGSFRGPGSTSGIPSLRDGNFRSKRSAFRIEIGNWAWNWPKFSPGSELSDGLNLKLFGTDLRKYLYDRMQREFRLGFLIEQQALAKNCVTIDDRYRDQLGNYRPIINYNITDHEKEGMLAAKHFSQQFFKAIGGEDKTEYDPNSGGYIRYKNEDLWWKGAGHFAGTHLMGTDATNSVVNAEQRCHEHHNLFLVGCGNMPTMGTSNPTLTIAALSFWAAENIAKDLRTA